MSSPCPSHLSRRPDREPRSPTTHERPNAQGAEESSPVPSRVARSAMRDKGWVDRASDQHHTAVGPGSPANPGLVCWGGDRSGDERRSDIKKHFHDRLGPSLTMPPRWICFKHPLVPPGAAPPATSPGTAPCTWYRSCRPGNQDRQEYACAEESWCVCPLR